MAAAHKPGLLWAFDSLYVVANRSEARGGSGLYRLRDRDGDDRLKETRLLRAISGEGEHGPHALVPRPDGRSLHLVAGNATFLPQPEVSLVPRNWAMDALLPNLGQSDGVWRTNRPGGWVCRLDPEGRSWELVAVGLRNPYDIAFNADGELFTFDADMEWDVGSRRYSWATRAMGRFMRSPWNPTGRPIAARSSPSSRARLCRSPTW